MRGNRAICQIKRRLTERDDNATNNRTARSGIPGYLHSRRICKYLIPVDCYLLRSTTKCPICRRVYIGSLHKRIAAVTTSECRWRFRVVIQPMTAPDVALRTFCSLRNETSSEEILFASDAQVAEQHGFSHLQNRILFISRHAPRQRTRGTNMSKPLKSRVRHRTQRLFVHGRRMFRSFVSFVTFVMRFLKPLWRRCLGWIGGG